VHIAYFSFASKCESLFYLLIHAVSPMVFGLPVSVSFGYETNSCIRLLKELLVRSRTILQ
jgi:hypothetical protein